MRSQEWQFISVAGSVGEKQSQVLPTLRCEPRRQTEMEEQGAGIEYLTLPAMGRGRQNNKELINLGNIKLLSLSYIKNGCKK